MKIVGIASAEQGTSSGVGKDAVADRLVAAHGYVRIALADNLKRFLRRVFDLDEDQLWGGAKEAPDLRYGSAWENRSHWLDAWRRLEAEGPAWLESIGIGFHRMPELRRWFLGVMGEHNVLHDAKPRFASGRSLAQSIGTEFARSVECGVWHRVLFETVDRMATMIAHGKPVSYNPSHGLWLNVRGTAVAPTGVVVPDVRYQDEAEAIADRGLLIAVERNGVSRLTGDFATHASERNEIAPTLFGGVVRNDGTIEALHAKVDFIFSDNGYQERQAAE